MFWQPLHESKTEEEYGVLGVLVEMGQAGLWGNGGTGLSAKHPFQEPVSKVVCLISFTHTNKKQEELKCQNHFQTPRNEIRIMSK